MKGSRRLKVESSNDEVEAAKKYLEQSKAMQEYQDKRKEAIREYNKLSWIDKVKLDPNRLDKL